MSVLNRVSTVGPCQIDVMFLRQIVTEVGPGWQAKKKKKKKSEYH